MTSIHSHDHHRKPEQYREMGGSCMGLVACHYDLLGLCCQVSLTQPGTRAEGISADMAVLHHTAPLMPCLLHSSTSPNLVLPRVSSEVRSLILPLLSTGPLPLCHPFCMASPERARIIPGW